MTYSRNPCLTAPLAPDRPRRHNSPPIKALSALVPVAGLSSLASSGPLVPLAPLVSRNRTGLALVLPALAAAALSALLGTDATRIGK
ncbi:hypothetical protein ACWD4F_16695 [Streptomyces aureus]|uniref:hypothetical protein n=1 Tax=Streptomyces aureus TaxID=193461 RepID=UPI000569FD4B|nr:hypothetical protein [Streptomyces aureus]